MPTNRSNRRSGADRRRRTDRRSGKDRRKPTDPKYAGPERRGSQIIDDDPRCQLCAASLGDLEVLILECPFPHKDCLYQQRHETIHYVTYPSVRTANETTVVASIGSDILSTNIILKRPDPIMPNRQIYYIDVTDGPAG